ncbi:MAG: HD domain-containing protein [Patescibacteria group bacterium]
MQRWNDQIRPVELRELDKQAHKMMIAYVLGKLHERDAGFNWLTLIESGFFEFIQRLIITDLKPQLFYKIKSNPRKYRELNDWMYRQIRPDIVSLSNGFIGRFRTYINSTGKKDINGRILAAAHFYATRWEFEIIKRANPDSHYINKIGEQLTKQETSLDQIEGMKTIKSKRGYRELIDLCGQLRFQVRWSHLHRIPRTSVLGHMLVVALFSYLFSVEIGACEKRTVNNYLTGLFHDLPEALTRDVINPVKRSSKGLETLIKTYENEQMNEQVYSLLPDFTGDLKFFTVNEFSNTVTINRRRVPKSPSVITKAYNDNKFNPRDGVLVKAADDMAAFIEALLALKNGAHSEPLNEALRAIPKKYANKKIGSLPVSTLYQELLA